MRRGGRSNAAGNRRERRVGSQILTGTGRILGNSAADRVPWLFEQPRFALRTRGQRPTTRWRSLPVARPRSRCAAPAKGSVVRGGGHSALAVVVRAVFPEPRRRGEVQIADFVYRSVWHGSCLKALRARLRPEGPVDEEEWEHGIRRCRRVSGGSRVASVAAGRAGHTLDCGVKRRAASAAPYPPSTRNVEGPGRKARNRLLARRYVFVPSAPRSASARSSRRLSSAREDFSRQIVQPGRSCLPSAGRDDISSVYPRDDRPGPATEPTVLAYNRGHALVKRAGGELWRSPHQSSAFAR
jgi:hypothetical protein